MTASRLYQTLRFLVTLDGQLRLQVALQRILETLNELVRSPANTAHQSALADALTEFSAGAQKLQASISPAQSANIDEVGGAEFFDPQIAARVQHSISTNAMTPGVARDFVQQLYSNREGFLSTVRTTSEGLAKLNVTEDTLPAGHADISFLIPRGLFANDLDEFAKELKFISRLLQDISEGHTGERRTPELQSLSSSTPTVTLETLPAIIGIVGSIVTMFLTAWEKIERIRRIRSEAAEMGMKAKTLEEFDEQITTKVEEVVEQSTTLVLANYREDQPARKHELENAIATDLRRLFGQIERGLTIEVRAQPDRNQSDGDVTQTLQNITDIGRELKFPPAAKEPLLLTSGEVLEGELAPLDATPDGGSQTLLSQVTKNKTSRTTETTTKRRGKKGSSDGTDG